MTDEIKPLPFKWEDHPTATGFTAQTVDTISIDFSDAITIDNTMMSSIPSISTVTGSNGSSWISNTASSISFTDPYEEMEKRLKRLEDIIEEEQRIRDECPAVRNAYDEYRFLLVLAKRNKGDLLTDNS